MAQQDDLQTHEHTYDRMIRMLKWSTIAVAVIAAFVVWLIA